MPLMAPQLLQDKAPNPNLAFEALHRAVPTVQPALPPFVPPVAQPRPLRLPWPGSLGSCSLSVLSLQPTSSASLWPGAASPTWMASASSLAPSSPFSTWQPDDHY